MSAVPSTLSASSEAEERSFSPRTILIAEDDADLRATLTGILGLGGHTVLEAGDGQAALELLRTQQVDLLILDLHMPRCDGVSVLRQIDAPPPIVIVYSAFEYYSTDDVAEQVGRKVFRALRKPVPPRKLIATVNEALEEIGHSDG